MRCSPQAPPRPSAPARLLPNGPTRAAVRPARVITAQTSVPRPRRRTTANVEIAHRPSAPWGGALDAVLRVQPALARLHPLLAATAPDQRRRIRRNTVERTRPLVNERLPLLRRPAPSLHHRPPPFPAAPVSSTPPPADRSRATSDRIGGAAPRPIARSLAASGGLTLTSFGPRPLRGPVCRLQLSVCAAYYSRPTA